MKSRLLPSLVTALGIIFMSLPGLADKPPALAPDLVIVNAMVHTMDPSQPVAEAVAIHGNRIVAVGASKEIKKMAGPRRRIVDAQERVVLPGFNDSHVHFLIGGFQLSSVEGRPESLRCQKLVVVSLSIVGSMNGGYLNGVIPLSSSVGKSYWLLSFDE